MHAIETRLVSLLGTVYLISPLRPEDEGRLRDFFCSHSAETILARYGCMIGAMTHERARALVGVDQLRDVALGVFHAATSWKPLYAVGRYYTEGTTGTAEVAFVVHEASRRCGMATLLLQQLAEIGRARGLTAFTAQVRLDNAAMRAVFDRYRPALEPLPGSGCVQYRVPLDHIPPP